MKIRSMTRNLEKPVFFLKEYPCDGVKEIVHDKQVKKHVRLHEGWHQDFFVAVATITLCTTLKMLVKSWLKEKC